MLSRIYYAASVNRQGVDHLSRGSGKKAFECFRKALKLLKEFEEPPEESKANSSLFQQEQHEEDPHHPHSCSSVPVPHFEDKEFYIYGNALMFDPFSTCSPHLSLDFYGAVILFNMGLSLHWKGKDRCEQKALERSVTCYELSLQLLEDLDEQSYVSNMLLTAIWNNMSHIHFLLGEHDTALDMLDEIRKLSSSLRGMKNNSIVFQPGHVEEFFLNGVVMRAGPHAAAA